MRRAIINGCEPGWIFQEAVRRQPESLAERMAAPVKLGNTTHSSE